MLSRYRYQLSVGLAVVGAALLGVGTAAASPATNCTAAGGAVRIDAGDIIMRPTGVSSPAWTGSQQYLLYCNDTSHPLVGQAVTLSASSATLPASDFTFENETGYTDLSGTGNPVTATTDSSGHMHFTINSNVSNLNVDVAVQQYGEVGVGVAVSTGGGTIGGGTILAQTPELDSIALFGTGAMGMAGYAIMRLRAARARREDG